MGYTSPWAGGTQRRHPASYLVGGGGEPREQGQQGLLGLGLRQAELLLRLLLWGVRAGLRGECGGQPGRSGGPFRQDVRAEEQHQQSPRRQTKPGAPVALEGKAQLRSSIKDSLLPTSPGETGGRVGRGHTRRGRVGPRVDSGAALSPGLPCTRLQALLTSLTKASLEPTLTLAWVRDRSFSSQLFSAEARASMAFQFFSRRSWEERGMVNSQAGLCRAGKPP